MALTLTITNAGRAALINADGSGTRAVRVARVGVSGSNVAASVAATTLPGEVKRIDTLSGDKVAADVIHLVVRDESMAVYTVRSLALYLDDGTLFALYGQADPIVEKSAQALLLLAIDVTLQDIAAGQVTFGNANFLLPPATTDRLGLIELATDAEAAALVDAVRALTPKNMATIFTAANILARMLQVDGAGSGLDADLLDGRQAAEFALLASGPMFAGAVSAAHATAEGAAVSFSNTSANGYGAYFCGGGPSRYAATFFDYTGGNLLFNISGLGDLTVRRGASFGAGLTVQGSPVCHAGNDGAGSGFDADLLDGRQAAEFALLASAPTFAGAVSALHGTAEASAGSFSNTSATGYGPYFSGGGGSRYAASFYDYTGANLLLMLGGAGDLTVRRGAAFGATVTVQGNQVCHAGNDGAGSGFDADLLDGRQGAEFALLTGANFSGAIMVAGNVVWTSANDGAGSGLDADLLDGRQAAEFALLTGAIFSGAVGRDALFYMQLFGTLAQIVFGTNAQINFDRQNRIFNFSIDGANPLLVTKDGAVVGENLALKRANAGRYIHYADGAINGDTITRGINPPAGGADGDQHIQIDTAAGTMRQWHNYAGTWVHN